MAEQEDSTKPRVVKRKREKHPRKPRTSVGIEGHVAKSLDSFPGSTRTARLILAVRLAKRTERWETWAAEALKILNVLANPIAGLQEVQRRELEMLVAKIPEGIET